VIGLPRTIIHRDGADAGKRDGEGSRATGADARSRQKERHLPMSTVWTELAAVALMTTVTAGATAAERTGEKEKAMRKKFFGSARWIWTAKERRNQFAVFAKTLSVPPGASGSLRARICASYHYELFVDGRFIARGPVHGDPKWCHVDEWSVPVEKNATEVDVAILVHHSNGTHLHYLTPAPAGLIASFRLGERTFGTDRSWKCRDLAMWAQRVKARNGALDYCEDYNAAREPKGWVERRFPPAVTDSWPNARLVPDADSIWGGYSERGLPRILRRMRTPERLTAWKTGTKGADRVVDISRFSDEEKLKRVVADERFTVDALNERLATANAFTLDLGREYVGFYTFDVEAPKGLVIEISGAELLRQGRPWIYRKGTCYSARYRTRNGRQRFTSFGWNGFRYLHVVIRGSTKGVRFHEVGCLERRADLTLERTFETSDRRLARIFDISRRTLHISSLEQIVDCPTREQTAAWCDSLFTAYSIWKGYGNRSYLDWYLEAFIRAPLSERGMIHSRYPGVLQHVWLDFALIPLIAQRLYHAETGSYYKPGPTLERGLVQKKWFDRHRNEKGLVDFDFESYYKNGWRNFIDHPGLNMHNAPHPGLDRDGTSCPLNIYFCNYVDTLAKLAKVTKHEQAAALAKQAKQLRAAIKSEFYDGNVFHDTKKKDGSLSPSTSWHANAFAVYFGIIEGDDARRALRAMIRGYDKLCRGTPYVYWYLLPSLRKVGMEREAIQLIKRDWGVMLDRDATTTWETFLGDERDSLCHPWAVAPFLFLIQKDAW
jgi:hypothetical protein